MGGGTKKHIRCYPHSLVLVDHAAIVPSKYYVHTVGVYRFKGFCVQGGGSADFGILFKGYVLLYFFNKYQH